MAATTTAPPLVQALAAHLVEARRYTEELLAPFGERDLVRQFSELQSPLVWDYAHIAHYEELWVLRNALGQASSMARFDHVYDAFAHPRAQRPALDLLPPPTARTFVASVRRRVLEALPELARRGDSRLAADGFVVGLVVQHELQHAETMTQTIQAADDVRYPLPDEPSGPARPAAGEVLVAGGVCAIGTCDPLWTYDNEQPRHELELAPFAIDRTAVTNADWLAFIADDGYRERRHWTADGWAWRGRENAVAPLYWRCGRDGYERRRLGVWGPVAPAEPVQHVCWYEADAYARWRGRRLPTEREWERAATLVAHDVEAANVGRRRFGPAAVGSSPESVDPGRCAGLLGDVWEWTSSPFDAYPGFAPYPYPEYSAVFFGSRYRVLRGGSWATHPLIARPTFRNWDLPERRQIFAGLRTARDV